VGFVELDPVNNHQGWKHEKITSSIARDFRSDESENFFNSVKITKNQNNA
jgi:hypothetical protein